MKILCFFSVFFMSVMVFSTDYTFRLPVKSNVSVCEQEDGKLVIRCCFEPTKIFSKQTNKMIDGKHAQHIAYNAIRAYLGNSKYPIQCSGFRHEKSPVYPGDDKCYYFFSVMKKSIQILPFPEKQKLADAKINHKLQDKKIAVQTSQRNVMDPKKDTLIASPTTITNNPVSKSIVISEDEIKDLELSGLFIRTKQDIKALQEFQKSKCLSLLQSDDFDGIEQLWRFYQEIFDSSEKLKNDLDNNRKLLGSEIDEAKSLIDRFIIELNREIKPIAIKQCDKMIQELKKDTQCMSTKDQYADIQELKNSLLKLQKYESFLREL